MQISSNGITLIENEEGLRLNPYLDTARIPTIGYGTIHYEDGTAVTMQDPPITAERASALFAGQLVQYENAVNALVTSTIGQNQYDALTSFTYNEGIGHFKSSTLLQKVNANPGDATIRDEFNKWVYSGGRVTPGLQKRRNDEANLYFAV